MRFLLDPCNTGVESTSGNSVHLFVCPSVCPSSLLILFLIQTLSLRNLPQSTLVTQPLPRYPMSPIHVSHARQSTGPPSQSTGPPSQSTGPPSQSTGQPMSLIQKKHRGRVMCQPEIFTLFSGLLLINGAKYERHYNSSLSIMLNQNEFEIDIKCRPQLSK